MTTAIIYSDEWRQFDYGPEHPLRMERLGLTWRLMEAYGLTAMPRSKVLGPRARRARRDRPLPLARVHRDPARGERGRLGAARRALRARSRRQPDLPWGCGRPRSSAPAGPCSRPGWSPTARPRGPSTSRAGCTHAMPGRASGFCYVTTRCWPSCACASAGCGWPTWTSTRITATGVQFAFYDDPNVLTVSHPRARRPGSSRAPGFVVEMGEARASGTRSTCRCSAHRRRGLPTRPSRRWSAAGDRLQARRPGHPARHRFAPDRPAQPT